MIRSFKHKGLRKYFETGNTSGIQPKHAVRLRTQLSVLDTIKSPDEINIVSWRLHALTGNLKGYWSITVNANWRITFRFEGENVYEVDYLDYH